MEKGFTQRQIEEEFSVGTLYRLMIANSARVQHENGKIESQKKYAKQQHVKYDMQKLSGMGNVVEKKGARTFRGRFYS